MRNGHRPDRTGILEHTIFDVAVVGGGVNGAAVFHRLAAKGYRVLLIDKGDFASGTSQASAMMIWGSLPDLRRFDLFGVGRFCAARERLLQGRNGSVRSEKYMYLPTAGNGRGPVPAGLALYLYWLLGRGRRSFPAYRREVPEHAFLKKGNFRWGFEYEEAGTALSDARFVLEWLLPHLPSEERAALNYCELVGGGYDRAGELWKLELLDRTDDREVTARARCVVNAAGVWTDRVNRSFGIETPYRHVFGKGVFIGLERHPRHRSRLMVETGSAEGCLAFVPWKSVALWGPTETRVADPEEGFGVRPEEVRFLLGELNRHLRKPATAEDIVSLRCGVRPLAVRNDVRNGADTRGIPRGYRVCGDTQRPWISIYGGKLTSCEAVARTVVRSLSGRLPRRDRRNFSLTLNLSPETETFPGVEEPFVSARWSHEREMCRTLEDYLRRRTNIAQWVRRGGLGRDDENLPVLNELALVFSDGDPERAEASVRRYRETVKRRFDSVLEAV